MPRLLLTFAILCFSAAAIADDGVGSIVYAKGNEFILPAGPGSWQPAKFGRTLNPGDRLRTGTFGALALLLRDETQIRLQRNSEFVIEAVRNESIETTALSVVSGALWSRAQALSRTVTAAVRKKRIVRMRTKNSTIGIRGTDWYVSIDPDTGTSRIVILSGAGEVSNEFGEVELTSGEEAIVENGKAPNKRVVIDLKDRPLMALEYRPIWLDLFTVSRLPAETGNASGDEILGAAAQAYDAGDYAQAATLLGSAPRGPQTDRLYLLKALIAARADDFEQSLSLLDQISTQVQGRTATLAALARVSVLALGKKFDEAVDVLDALPTPAVEPEVAVFRTVVLMQNAEYPAAIEYAKQAALRFPAISAFDTLLASAYLLTDETDEMLAAIERALAKNPNDNYAWHTRGIYYTHVAPHAEEAVASLQRAIEIKPHSIESWNNLALVYSDLGHFTQAKAAMSTARANGPDESLVLANSGVLAQNLDRLADADDYFDRAAIADPGQPYVHMGRGYQALNRGNTQAAIDEFLSAIAINPILPGAHTGLAVAYYQAGRFAAADATIKKAMEIDPDDPIAPQLGSSFNVDQANIGEAIRLAKDALAKSLKYDYFAVESLASARSGITNVGSAYLNVGLTDWANYYAQLAFTPYLANSYWLLSSVYAPRSIRASNGALNIALTLEPTALSIPNRYFQFVREPGNNLTVGGTYGTEDGAETWSGAASAQGFARIPIPIAYRLDYINSNNDGFRRNSQSDSESVNVSVGTRFADRKHHVAANFFASDSNEGRPGPITAVDPDDRDKTWSMSGALSYHLRFDYDNRVLARVGYQAIGAKFRNGSPAGRDTTDTLESLLFAFGEDRVRDLLGEGLTDLNTILGCTVTDPCLGIGDFFRPFGPPFTDELPDVVDDDIFASTDAITRSLNFQIRHMVRLNDVDFSYGAELLYQDAETTSNFNNFDFQGIGLLLDDTFASAFFAQFSARPESTKTESDPDGASVYAQARYKYSDDVWFEAGLFARYYDDDSTKEHSQLDPRVGFGWRFLDKHWLRVGYQRELVLPVSSLGPIAPLAVMGFVAPLTQTLNGSSFENIQAEWDAEWHPRIFTSIRFEEQSFDGWAPLSSPDGFLLYTDEARIRALNFALNVWLFERFGLAAKYVLADGVNQSDGGLDGSDLPLTPDSSFSASLNWIHPRQIRATIGGTYVGDRYGDLANAITLDDYWTVNASISWEPFDRHVSIGAGLVNLLDEDFDIAAGYPAPGRAAVLSMELRY